MTAERTPLFFFDTYALIERQSGSTAYARFEDVPIITHQWNVLEFIAAVLRRADEARTRAELGRLAPNLLDAGTDDLFAAAAFHRARRAKQVSYVDALGYVLARREGLRFLTGDRAFEGLDNVEYVSGRAPPQGGGRET